MSSFYLVTSIDDNTFEESVPTTPIGPVADATADAPAVINWDAVANARYYNIYKTINSIYGFVGVAGPDRTFTDDGIVPDPAVQPPVTRDALDSSDNRPAVSTYYQQRLMVANTNNEPESVFGSRTGLFTNFTISSPIRADDAIKFSMADVEVQEVRHLVGTLDLLLVLTGNSIRRVMGDAAGVLRPTEINPKQQSGFGASWVPPLIIGESMLYVERLGSMVRDMAFDLNAASFVGSDLTIFAAHLFEGFTLVRAAYARVPHSIAYFVRSDGVMVGLTYIKEQQIWAWHRHDTDGYYEDVQVVPEGLEDAVYVVVRRTIGGVQKRYIERFSSPIVADVKRNADTAFLDSFLTYDGRNQTATTMTLSGTDWGVITGDPPPDIAEVPDLTLTASAAFFQALDVGNEIVMRAPNSDGSTDEVRIKITAYTSTTAVSGRPNIEVPGTLRVTAVTDWDRAVDQVSGFDHLEGETIGLLADGNVLEPQIVVDGRVSLGGFYAVVHGGLPYLSDFETLDLDQAGSQVAASKKKVNVITLIVKNSRGIYAGPDLDNLSLRGQDLNTNEANDPNALITGKIEMGISSTWGQTGRFIVRQSDPLPLTILAAIPSVDIGG